MLCGWLCIVGFGCVCLVFVVSFCGGCYCGCFVLLLVVLLWVCSGFGLLLIAVLCGGWLLWNVCLGCFVCFTDAVCG